MVRYLFYTIGDLTCHKPLVLLLPEQRGDCFPFTGGNATPVLSTERCTEYIHCQDLLSGQRPQRIHVRFFTVTISSMAQIRAAHEHSIRRFKTGCLRTQDERDGSDRIGCSAPQRCHTPVARTCAASAASCGEMQQTYGQVPAIYNISLSLSLSHTHTHTHSRTV